MDMPEGVRVVHGAGLGGREQVGAVRMFFVLQYQQVHCLLRDGDGADGVGGLGLAHLQLAVDPVHLLGHRDGLVFNVQVRPQQGQQFAPAQAAGEFQVKDREVAPFSRIPGLGAYLSRKEQLDLILFDRVQLDGPEMIRL